MLSRSPYQSTDTAGVWLPQGEDCETARPSINDIKTISISLLASALDALLFKELPKIIASPLEEVKWHYNPLCHGCRYEPECRTRAQGKGEIGSMPNISIDDARVLKDLLRLSRGPALPKSEKRLPDIEELHELFGDRAKVDYLAKSSPSVVKRARQILAIPKKVSMGQKSMRSPVIEASRTKEIQVSSGHTTKEFYEHLLSNIKGYSTSQLYVSKQRRYRSYYIYHQRPVFSRQGWRLFQRYCPF